VLEDLGLEVALRQLTEEVEDRHSVRTRFSVRGVPTGIPSDTALSLYRIAQEALTNVAKHAAADSVDITLAGEPDSLTLFVRDSGQGFNPDAVKECGGLGLISMRQRAELIGGTLEVQSGLGQGTQIVVCAPLGR
jgi:signal transduction histidine kinase